MANEFDPYHVWLGIPADEQPADHYRLLGLRAFESHADVIDHAADRQMAHLRSFSAGERAVIAQRLLNEVAAARVCLLDADAKAKYDAGLRAARAKAEAAAAPPPVPSARPVARAIPVQANRPVPASAAAPPVVVGASPLRGRRQTSPVVIAIGFGAAVFVVGLLIVWAVGNRPQVAEKPRDGTTTQGGQSQPKPSTPGDAARPDEPKPPVGDGGSTEKPPNAMPAQPDDAPADAVPPTVPKDTMPKDAASKDTSPKPVESTPGDMPPMPPEPDEPKDRSPKTADAPAKPDDDAPFESLLDGDPTKGDAKTTDAPTVPAAKRLPVPDAAAVAAKEQEIRGLLAKDFARNRPQEIWAFGRQLLGIARQTQGDVVGRYVTLRLAVDRASAAGDSETAQTAAEEIAREFDMDRLQVVGEALLATARGGVPLAARDTALQHLDAWTRTAFAADRLKLASDLAAEWTKLSALVREPTAIADAREYRDRIAAAAEAWPAVEKAQATLQTKPDDGAANATVGRYLALVKGNWPRGLEHLAKSNDATLKSLAEADLAAKNDANAAVDVADRWAKFADSAGGLESENVADHALALYAAELSSATGPTKKRAMDGIERLQQNHGVWFDVMHTISPQRDSVAGDWTRLQNDGLSGSILRTTASLNTIIEPSGSYEFTCEFIRDKPSGNIFFFIPVGDRACVIALDGMDSFSWLDTIDGQRGTNKNPTAVHPSGIVSGQRYTLHATVRVAGDTAQILVRLNGRNYMGFRGGLNRIGREKTFKNPCDPRHLGIGFWHTQVSYYSLKYRAIK